MKKLFTMTLLLAAVASASFGQAPEKKAEASPNPQTAAASPELFAEIERMDSAISEAFNSHNLPRLMGLFRRDLEFYQDNEGLELYDQTLKGFRSLFAQNNGLRRELVKGSLEVYPIKNYGAIEIGSHKFCHLENGKEECGTFNFVHVWQKKGGEWRIARVISYNH